MPQRMIITGTRGAGKTTFCKEVATLLKEKGINVKGVISPAIIERGVKVGIDLLNLATGERQTLARLVQPTDRIRTPRWGFCDEVIAWGNEIFQTSTPCDVLVVDELGPLELICGEGWQQGLKAIDSGDFRLALIVIRPALLQLASKKWPDVEVVNIEPFLNPIPFVDKSLQTHF